MYSVVVDGMGIFATLFSV